VKEFSVIWIWKGKENMEINGKIVHVLNELSGNGKNGTWRKKEYVLETSGNFPKKVCFMVWGDKIDQFNLQQGDNVNVSIEIESREYNGKWYTDIKAWKVDKGSSGGHSEGISKNLNDFSDVATFNDEGEDSVLPF
jgi:hypothetical protein